MPESRRRDRAPGRLPDAARQRSRPDACPGAWRRHDAADGALARFRLVGGALTASELTLLAGASVQGGSPLEITSRGSVQVRGLAPSTADDLADALRGQANGQANGQAAVLDERGRDLPCSLVTSPWSGALDEAAGSVAAGLRGRTDVPGRFLMALDDGTGDVAGLGADVTIISPAPRSGAENVAFLPSRGSNGSSLPRDGELPREGAALLLDGTDTGVRHPDAAALALAAVDAFLAVRDGHWRLAELPDAVALVTGGVRERLDVEHHPATITPPPPRASRPAQHDGGLEVLPPLGELDLTAVSALVATGATLRITPWRTVVLRGLTDPTATAHALADAGLATDPDTPWAGLSACVGAPRCAKSHTDVRGDLAAAVRDGRAGRGVVPAHWVGCSRACGTPGGRVAVVEATPESSESLGGRYRTVVRAGRVAR